MCKILLSHSQWALVDLWRWRIGHFHTVGDGYLYYWMLPHSFKGLKLKFNRNLEKKLEFNLISIKLLLKVSYIQLWKCPEKL